MSSLGGPGCSFLSNIRQTWATSVPREMLSPNVTQHIVKSDVAVIYGKFCGLLWLHAEVFFLGFF